MVFFRLLILDDFHFNNGNYIVRCLILFGGGLITLFGAHLVHYEEAGGLVTITLSFVAGIKWRKEGWGEHNPVNKILKKIWIV